MLHNNVVQNRDKCYFDPESNILSASDTILKNAACMDKWIKFLSDKRSKCIEKWEKSFVEHISTYSSVRSLSSLDQLCDWDSNLISRLKNEWFIVAFDKIETRNIPANTSVYIKLSR